jgi:c-di-AMP phosphodiesterase-like protein
MISPYKKLGYKILFVYFIVLILLCFIFYESLILLAVLFISATLLSALAFNRLADKIDREELSKAFDRCAEEAIQEGVMVQ